MLKVQSVFLKAHGGNSGFGVFGGFGFLSQEMGRVLHGGCVPPLKVVFRITFCTGSQPLLP